MVHRTGFAIMAAIGGLSDSPTHSPEALPGGTTVSLTARIPVVTRAAVTSLVADKPLAGALPRHVPGVGAHRARLICGREGCTKAPDMAVVFA